MRPNVVLSLTTIMFLSLSSAHAMKFQTLGYKALGMGGASVSNSASSLSAYNNPALLGANRNSAEISASVGLGIVDYGVLKEVQKLDENGYAEALDKAANDTANLTDSDKEVLISGTESIINLDGEGVAIDPQAYIGMQLSHLGFGIFESTDANFLATVDQEHNQLYFKNDTTGTIIYKDLEGNDVTKKEYEDHSIEYALNNDLTYLNQKAIALVELPIAYGHRFNTKIGKVMVGGAFKYMQALTINEHFKIADTKEENGNESEADTYQEKQSENYGIDLGLAYIPRFAKKLTIGLVAKNLNSPSFDFEDGSKYTIEPMVRLGLSYQLFNDLEFAADVDLTSNKFIYEGVENQMVGGGVSYEPFSSFFQLALRAGAMKNLYKNDKVGLIYTAGIGAGFKWFSLDLSAQASGENSEVQGTPIPQQSKVNLALISRW